MKKDMAEQDFIYWPDYNPDEIRTWDIKKVKSTWYMIWGNCMVGNKPPEYFGDLCVALLQRGKELGIDLVKELI